MDFPKSVPSVGLVDGKFVDEDVVAGTPGSLIPAQWGNAVSEEVLNVISSASLTPDENNNAQLLAAINAKITAAIPVSPPNASTTVQGLVELATDAEAQTGTDALRAVTPAALSSRIASTTVSGLIKLATVAETQAGTDVQRAVTPVTLSSRIATETQTGLARVASQYETNLGTNDTVIVTPAKLKSWSENWLFTAEFPVSPGTANAIAFPTNKFPNSFNIRLKCTGSTGTAGYLVGDEVEFGSWVYNSISTANNTGAYLHSFTSSGCVLMQASGTSSFLPHKTTGAVTAITLASFSIVVRMTQ